MLKNILLTVIAVLIAGGALMIYGTYKAADEFVQQNEPQLRQYIQLDEAAQNKFVMDNVDKLLKEIAVADVEPDEKADAELFNEAQKYPEVQAALLKFGRSFFAKAILHSDALAAEVKAEAKAKFQTEADAFADNLKAYGDIVGQVAEKIKAAK